MVYTSGQDTYGVIKFVIVTQHLACLFSQFFSFFKFHKTIILKRAYLKLLRMLFIQLMQFVAFSSNPEWSVCRQKIQHEIFLEPSII